jgi:hypothetical protein
MATKKENKEYREGFIDKWGIAPSTMFSFAKKIGIESIRGLSDETRGLIAEAYREHKDFEGTYGVSRDCFDTWLKNTHNLTRKDVFSELEDYVNQYKAKRMFKFTPKEDMWNMLHAMVNGAPLSEEQEALYAFLKEEKEDEEA